MSSTLIDALAAALASDTPLPVATDVTIKQSRIIVMPGIQIRDGELDPKTIEDYKDYYANGKKMPALSVWRLTDYPDLGEKLVLSAGFQRKEAQDQLHGGGKGVPPTEDYDLVVDIFEGVLNDAMLHAGQSNLEHGKPLTRHEREMAMVRYLKLTNRSYSYIAKLFGVAVSTVSDIDKRNKARPSAPAAQGAEPEKRLVIRRGTAYLQDKPPGTPAAANSDGAGKKATATPATQEPAAPPAAQETHSPGNFVRPRPAGEQEPTPGAQANLVKGPTFTEPAATETAPIDGITPAIALEILAQTMDVARWLKSRDDIQAYELHRLVTQIVASIERSEQ